MNINKLVVILKQLVEQPSTADNMPAVERSLAILEKEFGVALKCRRERFRDRPILVFSSTAAKKVDLIIAGHIDVVPAEKAMFNLAVSVDRLCGRGVYDMKGPLLASLFAVRDFFCERHKELSIAVFVTSDEEVDGLSTRYLLHELGWRARFAILPDGGSEREIITREKGFCQVRATVSGRSAHAARPWQGKNPIAAVAELYAALQSRFPNPTAEDDWRTSVTITKVASGTALNQIPARAEALFDIRYVNFSDRRSAMGMIRKVIGYRNQMELLVDNPPFSVDETNRHVHKLQQAVRSVSRRPVKTTGEAATSDAVYFSEQGIPAVLFRPKGGGTHQDKEWVSRRSLAQFYDIIKIFLADFWPKEVVYKQKQYPHQ